MAELYSPDVICLSEHFLSQPDLEAFHIPGYRVASGYCRSKTKRGGVCILLSNSFQFQVVDVSSFCIEELCELAAVKLEIQGKHYFILAVYRPPHSNCSDIDVFISCLNRCLDRFLGQNVQAIITGDFNIDLSVKGRSSKLLVGLMSSFGLRDTIVGYTREIGGSSSLIDNIFTNVVPDRFTSSILVTGVSDHYAQLGDVALSVSLKNGSPSFKLTRSFSQDNIRVFNSFLRHENWEEMYNCIGIDDKFKTFISIIHYYFQQSFPERKVRIRDSKSTKKIVLNEDILRMRDELLLLYSRTKHLQSGHPLKQEYAALKRKFRACVRASKATLVAEKISKSQNIQKTVWNIVNNLIPGKGAKQFSRIVLENEEGNILDSPKVVSDMFNNFFVGVCERLGDGHSVVEETGTVSKNKSSSTLYLYPTTVEEVLDVINSLKLGDSSGQDGISSRILKASSAVLAPPLEYLINESLLCGRFPSCLKLATVKPLLKSGDPKNAVNYRPISILSTFSKVVERVFLNRLTSFLTTNGVLFQNQFGFRKNLSTLNAMFNFISNVASSLDTRMHSLGLFLDLSKAFDVVNHNLLLKKLAALGIRGVGYDWLSSYLLERRQVVETEFTDSSGCLRMQKSEELFLRSGVPQGSVLGPVLFLLFINDVCSCVDRANLCLFADDTSLSVSNKSLDCLEIETFIQGNSLLQWMMRNGLFINTDKTKCLHFKHRNAKDSVDTVSIVFGEDLIEESKYTNFLGLFVDNNLSFSDHIDHVSGKLGKALFLLRRLKCFNDQNVLLTAYYGCFFPHMTYALPIWGCENGKTFHIFKLQKRALRIIFGLSSRESCKGVFRTNNMLTFPSAYILECLNFTVSNIHLFEERQSTYTVRHPILLAIPKHKTTLFERQGYYMCIKLFNKLPLSLRSVRDPVKFRRKLKSILVSKEYYCIEDFFTDNTI